MIRISKCPLPSRPVRQTKNQNQKNSQKVKKGKNQTNFVPWNKDKVVGQKLPLTLDQARKIKTHLLAEKNWFHLSLFLTGIDSMLRSSDLLALKVSDVFYPKSFQLRDRMEIKQGKTGKSVLFTVSNSTAEILRKHIQINDLVWEDEIFGNRAGKTAITPRHYRRLIKRWIASIGLEASAYSSHSLRRTKPSILYRKTGDFESIRILLGHSSLGATSSYLGVSVDQALKLGQSIQI